MQKKSGTLKKIFLSISLFIVLFWVIIGYSSYASNVTDLTTSINGPSSANNGDLVDYSIIFSQASALSIVSDATYSIKAGNGITIKSITCTTHHGAAICPSNVTMSGSIPLLPLNSGIEFTVHARYNANSPSSVSLSAQINSPSTYLDTNTDNNTANINTQIKRVFGKLWTTIERVDASGNIISGDINWGDRLYYKVTHVNLGPGVADNSLIVTKLMTGGYGLNGWIFSYTGLQITCIPSVWISCPNSDYTGNYNDVFGGGYQYDWNWVRSWGYPPYLLPNNQTNITTGSGKMGSFWDLWSAVTYNGLAYTRPTNEWPAGGMIQYLISFIPEKQLLPTPDVCNTQYKWEQLGGISTTSATSINRPDNLAWDDTSYIVWSQTPYIWIWKQICPEVNFSTRIISTWNFQWNQPVEIIISHTNSGSTNASGATVAWGTDWWSATVYSSNAQQSYTTYKNLSITCTWQWGAICPDTPTYPSNVTFTGSIPRYAGIVSNWPPGWSLVYSIKFTPLDYQWTDDGRCYGSGNIVSPKQRISASIWTPDSVYNSRPNNSSLYTDSSVPNFILPANCPSTDLSTSISFSGATGSRWEPVWKIGEPVEFTVTHMNSGTNVDNSTLINHIFGVLQERWYYGSTWLEYSSLNIQCSSTGWVSCPPLLTQLSSDWVFSSTWDNIFYTAKVDHWPSGGQLKYKVTFIPTKDRHPSACTETGWRANRGFWGLDGESTIGQGSADTNGGNNQAYTNSITLQNNSDTCNPWDLKSTITSSVTGSGWQYGQKVTYLITHENIGTNPIDVARIMARPILDGNTYRTPIRTRALTVQCTASTGMTCPTEDITYNEWEYSPYAHDYTQYLPSGQYFIAFLVAPNTTSFMSNIINQLSTWNSSPQVYYSRVVHNWPAGWKLSYLISFYPEKPDPVPAWDSWVINTWEAATSEIGTINNFETNSWDNVAKITPENWTLTNSDLAFSVKPVPRYPKPGDSMNIVFSVWNAGWANSTNSLLNVTIPSAFIPDGTPVWCETTGTSICPNPWDLIYDPNTRIFSGMIPLLVTGNPNILTITLHGSVRNDAQINTQATISGSIQSNTTNSTDPNPGTNNATNTFIIRSGDETITKSVQTGSVLPGGIIEYTVTIHGNSIAPLENIKIEDTLNNGNTFKDSDTPIFIGGDSSPNGDLTSSPLVGATSLTWNITKIKALQDIIIKYRVKVPMDPSSCGTIINNSATFSYSWEISGNGTKTYDGNDPLNTWEDVSIDCAPHVVIEPTVSSPTASWGSILNWNIEMQNISSFPTTLPITLTGTIDHPEYLSWGSISFPWCISVSAWKFVCTTPHPLAAGESVVFTATGQLSYGANGTLTLDTSNHTPSIGSLLIDCRPNNCKSSTILSSIQKVLVVGNVLGWEGIGTTKLVGSYIQQSDISSIYAATINTLRKNLTLAIRNTQNINTPLPLLEYKSGNNCTITTSSFQCYGWSFVYNNEKSTIIVQWGDIILSGSTIGNASAVHPRALIALKSDTGVGWHVYIDGSVQNIYSSLIAEDGISWIGSTTSKQLYIHGSVIGKNLLCSSTSASCPNDISQLRNFTGLSSDLANPLWESNPPIPDYTSASVIIEYDPRMLLDPPPLFVQ